MRALSRNDDPPDEVEAPEAYQTVLDFFSAENEEQCKHRIYKGTSCGAWIEFTESGIVIGSIVEGLDFGTMTYPLHYADNFTIKDIQDRVNAVEDEANDLWKWGNEACDKHGRKRRNGAHTEASLGCEAPDTSCNYGMYEQGERSA